MAVFVLESGNFACEELGWEGRFYKTTNQIPKPWGPRCSCPFFYICVIFIHSLGSYILTWDELRLRLRPRREEKRPPSATFLYTYLHLHSCKHTTFHLSLIHICYRLYLLIFPLLPLLVLRLTLMWLFFWSDMIWSGLVWSMFSFLPGAPLEANVSDK